MNPNYKTLGLEEGASQEAIQTAYDRLSKELDPANNDNLEFFVEEYKKIQKAYKALYNTSILATEQGAKQPLANQNREEIDIDSKKNLKESKKETSMISLSKYFLNRKKNLTLAFIITLLIKVLINYHYYRNKGIESQWLGYWTKKEYGDSARESTKVFGDIIIDLPFLNHIEDVFKIDTLWLFIPSTIIVLFFAWFFNDKIKAR